MQCVSYFQVNYLLLRDDSNNPSNTNRSNGSTMMTCSDSITPAVPVICPSASTPTDTNHITHIFHIFHITMTAAVTAASTSDLTSTDAQWEEIKAIFIVIGMLIAMTFLMSAGGMVGAHVISVALDLLRIRADGLKARRQKNVNAGLDLELQHESNLKAPEIHR